MKVFLTGLSILTATVLPSAAQFSPGPNPVTGNVGAQTLSSGTGTVSATGNINPSGNTVAVSLSGSSTLNNSGTIQQAGTGRAVDSVASASTLTINNSGHISSVSADAIRVNSSNSSVNLTNSGTISVSNGGQAIDFAAITTGSNTVINQAGGVISTVGEDAVRPGTNGVVNNAGFISATVTGGASPSGSDGIDLRTFSGISVTNSGTISGRHGIATDGANAGPSTLTVSNTGGLITAINGSGINVDGVSVTVTANVTNSLGGTIRGGVSVAATEADGDGIDIDGILTLNNSGDILGVGAKGSGNNAEGVSIGGGTIINTTSGRIIGSSQQGDTSAAGNGILVDNSSGSSAIGSATITNSGLIQGEDGFAIRMIGTFGDSITNNATGTIRGAGTGAAIQAGGGADTVTNRGAIISDIGNALDLEAGDDTLVVEGGSASIVGNISGGSGSNALTIKPGTGNAFAYSGTISNFNTVTVESGSVTFSGDNTYSGLTSVTGGTLLLSGGGNLGTGDVAVAAGAELDLTGLAAASFTIGAGRNLTVGGTINATSKTLIAGGVVNPGASPGLMTVEGGFSLLDEGDLMMEVAGLDRGVTYDALNVSGLFTLDGDVIVTSSYVFLLNDSLDLIDFGSIDASAFQAGELILPTLSQGLFWDTANFTTDGTVSVVPEPSAMLLSAGGALLLLARRRRKA